MLVEGKTNESRRETRINKRIKEKEKQAPYLLPQSNLQMSRFVSVETKEEKSYRVSLFKQERQMRVPIWFCLLSNVDKITFPTEDVRAGGVG